MNQDAGEPSSFNTIAWKVEKAVKGIFVAFIPSYLRSLVFNFWFDFFFYPGFT